MSKSVYIFDIGNVLIRWDPEELALNIKKNEKNFPLEIGQIPLSKDWEELDRGVLCVSQVVQRYACYFPEKFLNIYIKEAYASLSIIREGWDLLFQAKKEGKKIYLLSNLCFEFRNFLLTKFPLFSQVDGATYSCDIQSIKPELEIYQELLSCYKIAPEDAVFFDDKEENIWMAKQLGIEGRLFSRKASQMMN